MMKKTAGINIDACCFSSVMPLGEVAVDFGKESGMGQALGPQACHSQVRCVADAGRPEIRDSPLPLFGVDFRDGGGGHAEGLQGHKGRQAPQVGEQHTCDAEVAEEGECLDALLLHAVVAAFAHIAVLGQQLVKGGDDAVVNGQQVGIEGDQSAVSHTILFLKDPSDSVLI